MSIVSNEPEWVVERGGTAGPIRKIYNMEKLKAYNRPPYRVIRPGAPKPFHFSFKNQDMRKMGEI